jgi:hypothetical protein
LRDEIMQDVEALLSQKADSLWKRGKEELSKMNEDRSKVASSIAGLKDRQEALIAEQTALHSALIDITKNMEFVAIEMREALRAVGKVEAQPEAAPLLLPGITSLGISPLPQQVLEMENMEPGPTLQGLCTPPRLAQQGVASPPGFCLAPPLPGSPAVLLSLASALPSGPALSPTIAATVPGTTRLHIADCLDMSGCPATPCDAKDAASHAGGISSASTANSSPSVPPMGSIDISPSSSVSKMDMASPSATDTSNTSLPYEGPCWPPGLSKASGTLRADAPVFVPSGDL